MSGEGASPIDRIEARMVALELLFRGMLSGLVADQIDPIAEVDRMSEEFRSSFVLVNSGDQRAEQIRSLVFAMVEQTFDAVRNRVMRDIEIQATRAERKN